MKASELITKIEGGALAAYANIYSDLADQTARYTGVLREFISLYGDREACLFSVPGRTSRTSIPPRVTIASSKGRKPRSGIRRHLSV